MDRGGDHGVLAGSGLVAVTLTSAVAIYRAAGDIAAMAFVVTSYATLLLLFRSLRAYERAPPAAVAERERLRRTVWSLSTVLTVLFAWKVAGLMPWPLALLVWVLAAITVVGGFIAFFCLP